MSTEDSSSISGVLAAARSPNSDENSSTHSNITVDADKDTDVERFYYYLWTYGAPSIFTLIFTVGVIGNLLVVYVIASRPCMRNRVTNIFLLNLSVADLAFLFVCVPVTAYKFVAPTWLLGELFCQVATCLSYVTAYVTIYTLVAISILRFLLHLYSISVMFCYTPNK